MPDIPGIAGLDRAPCHDHRREGARRTCAKALRVLAEEGLLIRYPGLGYFVAGRAGR